MEVDSTNRYGITALSWAAVAGNEGLVSLLLRRKAGVNAESGFFYGLTTALQRAAASGHCLVARALCATS